MVEHCQNILKQKQSSQLTGQWFPNIGHIKIDKEQQS